MNSSWFKQVWRLALTAITVLIFFMAIRALYRLTKTVHYQDVLDAIAHIPTFHLFIAAIVVAFGYLVLTIYDFIATAKSAKNLITAMSPSPLLPLMPLVTPLDSILSPRVVSVIVTIAVLI